jgi:hypothetical protein
MQVDVALDEAPEPCDLQQRGGVEMSVPTMRAIVRRERLA